MNYVLFDPHWRRQLLPFTHTRPVADIRCGIMTMRERWEHFCATDTSTLCPDYMQGVFPHAGAGACLYLNGAVFADAQLWKAVSSLQAGQALIAGTMIVAVCTDESWTKPYESFEVFAQTNDMVVYDGSAACLQQVWDIFRQNGKAIGEDFALLTQGRSSAPVPEYVTTVNSGQIFIEPGAVIAPCILNASSGPIYIAADAEIMDGSLVRGPFALGKHAVLKMGAKVYGPTTIGDGCKVGGEVSNVVFFANSNKGHDGFLGNTVVGEWCNFGADSNCSNLKNNYDLVKIWDEDADKLINTGLQFCGLMMGDHSKCGINTMFNTGTIVGVSANIFGSGFPDKFVPSFSWGACDSTEVYQFDKAMETAGRMMERRGKTMSEAEKAMLQYVFDHRKHSH
ncbi:GlmU family protein [Rurimicrobium arvi]|uniref:GlmU family protein n=1 Tax=Rurimicrobium arvi TaxID=2049916 RepID=A0ABP8MW55_9BACT